MRRRCRKHGAAGCIQAQEQEVKLLLLLLPLLLIFVPHQALGRLPQLLRGGQQEDPAWRGAIRPRGARWRCVALWLQQELGAAAAAGATGAVYWSSCH